MVIPTTIRLVDFTSSLLLFDSASSGYAVATIGGDLPAISSSYAGYTLQVANSAPYSASWVAAANVAVTTAVSSSFAATASSADNLTVRGTLTAQTINVQTITSSIEFITGSTRNGSIAGNTHEFTGSVLMSGNLNVGSSVTSDDLILTAGTLFGTGTTGFSNRLSDTTLYLQMPASGFNITDNALNTRFSLSSAGAAIFLSTVTAGGQLITSAGQTGGYVTSTSGYVNETRTVSTNGTSYYLIKSTGTSNGSSTTTFNITGMSTTNGTYADIYAIAQKDATANAINTNVGVQINGQSMNLPTIQAGGTGANTVRCTFRVCRMESTWVIIGTPNTSYF
jgi:hypothetical protein